MITQPRPTIRLFSRRLTLLSSHLVPFRRSRTPVEIGIREFLTLGHFMTHGEPAKFELSVSNLVEEAWEVDGSANYSSAVGRPTS
jgi:hypothetical protein